jgi:FkbM family methyltransferase
MRWSRVSRIVRKLRLIAASDLVMVDKLRYLLDPSRQGSGLFTYRLRGGRTAMLRKGTTDFKVFDEIFVEQAYAPCIAALVSDLGCVTLLDLGANIGLSVLYIDRALEVDEIIAMEPDPGNFQLLSENLRRNELSNRCLTIRAFAGAKHAFAELHDSGNGAWGMRMGELSDTGIPVLTLAEIAALANRSSAKTGAPLLLKCDIEGGERHLFRHIRDWEQLIRYILLELHTEFLPVEEMIACLESSSFEWTVHGTRQPGASIVLLLLERGESRQAS